MWPKSRCFEKINIGANIKSSSNNFLRTDNTTHVLRASATGHSKPALNVRADSPVSDRSQEDDPDGRLKRVSNVWAD